MSYVSPPGRRLVENGGEGGENAPLDGSCLLSAIDHALQGLGCTKPFGVPTAAAFQHDRLNRWLADHPPLPCPPDRCAYCDGHIDTRASDALPVLRTLQPIQHLWLHLRCYPEWHAQRLAAARATLNMNITREQDG